MITREAIIKADCKIRGIDSSIPDEILNFMKEASIKSLEAQLANAEQLTCEYEPKDDGYLGTVYYFSCGYSYVTIEGDLKDNNINYCPSCGRKITSKDTQ